MSKYPLKLSDLRPPLLRLRSPAGTKSPSRGTARALIAVAALALAACADDTEPEAETTTTTTLAAATTTMPAATSTTSVGATAKCRTVAFTPNSEDAASEITATGLACDEAEAFVRVAGTRTSSGGPRELEVEGYRCMRTGTQQDPLPRADYECTKGPKKVTFVRS